MNFLKETNEAIKDSGHNYKDVMFIGSNDGKYRMTYEKFKEKANFKYDDGYGSASIAQDLIVYFKDNTYMKRGEYDGSEWWEYNTPKIFTESDEYLDFDVLGGDQFMWKNVKEMNDKNYDEHGYMIQLID